MTPLTHDGPRRRRRAGQGQDRGASPVELALVMGAVLALFALVLVFGMRWLAAQAAATAAGRALETAQSVDGTDPAATQVATALARSSRAITDVDVRIDRDTTTGTVTVAVTVHALLGGAVTRTATGPAARFLPQAQAR
ncbi:hypothetical protein [Frankia nepalensis]|uniref:hypothetical protein n=1 Tax=Frankia nepalensis TaxID=1836974 RepID=UPI001DC62DD0|nr:hypothetical protein [Frankia nepalensis]MBL7499302.1 hypothetical protein [Frankia nepalensis]MBL7512350.1 hypothetical protein [Frankia nepalensis]